MDVIEFKPSQLSVTIVKIYDNDVNKLKNTLSDKLSKAGKFLRGASVVLLPTCPLSAVQLAQMIEVLRQYEMVPIGLKTTDASLMDYAELAGLAVLSKLPTETHGQHNLNTPPTSTAQMVETTQSDTEKPSEKASVASQPKVAPLTPTGQKPSEQEEEILHTAKHIMHTLRSGQVEKHLFNDVVVRGSVNSGAEVFAGGDLTIYGATRGRIHAGATGNKQARIVTYNLNPELVSIAGIFLLADDIPRLAKQGWVEISLENDRLKFTNLN